MHCAPPYASTTGPEAVDLCRLAGLELDEWQQLVLRDSLGERDDGRWSAFEVGLIVPRQNGKSLLLQARALAGLFLLDEQLILFSAHEFKTAQEQFRNIRRIIEDTPTLRKRVAPRGIRTSHGEEGIELKDGRRLRFVARSTGSGRGFSADLVILDEAYNLPEEAMAALLPTLSSRPDPQVWYASSAGMEESSWLRKIRKKGTAGSSKRLAYFEWSAQTEAKDYERALDDREEWARANPALGIRIREEFIESELDAMGGMEFARERLGIWYDEEADVVIRQRDWAAVADAGTEPGEDSNLVFGVDVSLNRSHGAIAVAGAREDGLIHTELVDYREGTQWIVPRLVELIEKHNPAAVLIDPTGPAGGLLSILAEDGIEPRTAKGGKEILRLLTGRDGAQACGAFYDLVVNGELRHRDQKPVNDAVSGAKQRPMSDAWVWHRKESRFDVAPLVAETLAVQGFVLYGIPEPTPTPMIAWV
ncbi:hypothetical protein [Saccharopolyspora mangrovi]|uniref:Terminase n=1 Tax=Saccharopolyspora mangrovi TaxID=3082379 RepID=A0ABU6A773_9PSEU|nr:hypothetical protein [Saccharopolyspora sp. S2-29]MEB3367407.1 hypothetical protein [Saccharopolyspora sp. S2-29]